MPQGRTYQHSSLMVQRSGSVNSDGVSTELGKRREDWIQNDKCSVSNNYGKTGIQEIADSEEKNLIPADGFYE
ncbi:hypothetical protein [Paenibacillus glacialis]|uniref:Uncharacterized protein n=1 Tax=Paenibacillus glacialis TaxID=494026 RepID=A0A162LS09_9BACL|nr:hypothetical protein PGLA_19350 [Paenibacillus glacialis]